MLNVVREHGSKLTLTGEDWSFTFQPKEGGLKGTGTSPGSQVLVELKLTRWDWSGVWSGEADVPNVGVTDTITLQIANGTATLKHSFDGSVLLSTLQGGPPSQTGAGWSLGDEAHRYRMQPWGPDLKVTVEGRAPATWILHR